MLIGLVFIYLLDVVGLPMRFLVMDSIAPGMAAIKNLEPVPPQGQTMLLSHC